MPRTLHIAMAADTDFTVPLCLAMYSMVKTAGPDTHYRFHLLDSGIDRKLLDRGGFDYTCYDVRGLLADLPSGGRFPYSIYHRFLLPDILPAELERVLYLDCDIMVREDLTPLYDMPLGDFPVAAAPWLVLGDYAEEFGKILRGFPGRVGVEDDGTPYFYSSMLVMDLDRMRREGTAKQLIHYATNCPAGTLLWPDQDVINVVLRHRIARIPLRYNVIPLFLPGMGKESEDAQAAFRAPAIVHFAARKPNILTGPKDPLEEAFFSLWQESPWQRCIPYPFVSLREFPGIVVAMLQWPMRLFIRCPRFLHGYGKLLDCLRGR